MNVASMTARYAEIRKRMHGEPRRVNVYRPPEPPSADEPDARIETGPELLPCGARWREIVNEVAITREINAMEIVHGGRHHHLCIARFECWYRIRTEIIIMGRPVSYPQIGQWFGGMDHTTILHGVRKWARINGLQVPK